MYSGDKWADVSTFLSTSQIILVMSENTDFVWYVVCTK